MNNNISLFSREADKSLRNDKIIPFHHLNK